MNYGKIKYCDIANGPGCRTSLFVSGCRNNCPGCFNPETHDFEYGEPFTPDTLQKILDESRHYYIDGLSILGGEPLDERNREVVALICHSFRRAYPAKSIWVYTGYTWEQLMQKDPMRYLRLLSCVNVLVDGPFIEAEKDISLRFRGSRNQRMIDVPAMIRQYEEKAELSFPVMPWTDDEVYARHEMPADRRYSHF
jgi:anaerobic ribonucleoside-triphosphate reductase activating protein